MSMEELAHTIDQIRQEAEAVEQLAAQAEQTAQALHETAGQFAQTQAYQELATQLDSLARQLHQQAQRLRQQAEVFERQATQGQQAVNQQAEVGAAGAAGKAAPGQVGLQGALTGARQLADQVQEFTHKTQQLEQATGQFEQQTGRLVERTTDEPEKMTPGLTGAFHDNAKRLKDQTSEIHQRAERLGELAQDVAEQIQQAMQQPAAGHGRQEGGPSSEAGAPQSPRESGEEKPLDISPRQGSSSSGAGGSGYGGGISHEEPGASGLRPPEPPRTRVMPAPPVVPGAVRPGRPVSDAERDQAAQLLKQIPPVTKTSTEKKPSEPSDVTAYRRLRSQYSTTISTTRRELKAALRMEQVGETLGGLVEGDHLDSDSLGGIKGAPPEVMAVDVLPGEVNKAISLLIDISGSTEPGHGQRLEESVLHHEAIAAMIFREATRGIPGLTSEEYAFSNNPAIELRRYEERVTDQLSAEAHQQIFGLTHGGTADAAAIQAAITRMR